MHAYVNKYTYKNVHAKAQKNQKFKILVLHVIYLLIGK